MGEELGVEWYDNSYIKHSFLRCSPHKSPWYRVWKGIIANIGDDERIADFGCGGGQFAQLCISYGKKYVLGVDFSEVRIRGAKKRNSRYKDKFIVANLYDKAIYDNDYDVAVFSEVIEHMSDDLTVLSYIKSGKKIIMSVPSYDSAGHVRYFEGYRPIRLRYGDIIKINDITKVSIGRANNIFIVLGVKI